MSKIFGIGLPKSGTSSLHEALIQLGYRSIHNPDDKVTEKELRTAKYRLSVLDNSDAIMDTPIPAVFAQLDLAWPDSRFILTIRPLKSWLESSRKAGFNQSYARPKEGSTVDFYNSILYGCSVYDEDRFKWVYETHHNIVRDYFSGDKAEQLLILDFSKEVEWDDLCRFLNKPIPDTPFPHANPVSARRNLTTVEKQAVGLLVKLGIDYRWLRRKVNKFRNRNT